MFGSQSPGLSITTTSMFDNGLDSTFSIPIDPILSSAGVDSDKFCRFLDLFSLAYQPQQMKPGLSFGSLFRQVGGLQGRLVVAPFDLKN